VLLPLCLKDELDQVPRAEVVPGQSGRGEAAPDGSGGSVAGVMARDEEVIGQERREGSYPPA